MAALAVPAAEPDSKYDEEDEDDDRGDDYPDRVAELTRGQRAICIDLSLIDRYHPLHDSSIATLSASSATQKGLARAVQFGAGWIVGCGWARVCTV